MSQKHSFYIPDKNHLKWLYGLVGYLGRKVSVDHVCIFCNGRGRSFKSTEAVQKHMVIITTEI